MKVLFCITRSDTVGGAHVHVADMAAHLIGLGHQSGVLIGGEGVYAKVLHDRKIPVFSSRYMVRPVSPWNDLRAIGELRGIVSRVRPDVLSLHSAKAGILGRLAAVRLGCPVIFTAHGWSFTEGIDASRARLYRRLEQSLAPLADRIICVSEYDRQLAIRHGVGRPERLLTIHNGMPDSPIRAAPAQTAGPVRLLAVARLDQQKDHATLFAALEDLLDHEWTLDLVGDGPLEDELRQKAERTGIGARVRFLGLRRDVDRLLGASHIFVLPSNWEGFPRSILEAMRAGLPVIASDVGGVSESVADGRSGFLVPRGDVGRFRECVLRLITRPDEREQLGRHGRERFEREFLFDRMAAETIEVYRSLLGQRA